MHEIAVNEYKDNKQGKSITLNVTFISMYQHKVASDNLI